jgi:predicted nucleotidyltransferase
MNSTSRRIFPLRKPLSPLVLEPLKAVAQTANSLNLPYFLAGATARDLVLENIFGRAPGKLTRDLDFGFVLSDWKQFENLKAALISTGRFNPDRAIQRVLYQHSAGVSVRVDLIPFGGVQEGSQISWPPDNDLVMNVAGFREALKSAIHAQVDSDLVAPVSSLPGLNRTMKVRGECVDHGEKMTGTLQVEALSPEEAEGSLQFLGNAENAATTVNFKAKWTGAVCRTAP